MKPVTCWADMGIGEQQLLAMEEKDMIGIIAFIIWVTVFVGILSLTGPAGWFDLAVALALASVGAAWVYATLWWVRGKFKLFITAFRNSA